MNPQTLTNAPLAATLDRPPCGSLAGDAAATRQLGIEVYCRRRGVVVRLAGSAEMTEADRLRDRLEDLADQGVPRIVLDLSDVDFIGSPGLSAIVHGYLSARDRQGDLRLAAPQPAVLEVLRRARLTRLFPIYDSAEEALVS